MKKIISFIVSILIIIISLFGVSCNEEEAKSLVKYQEGMDYTKSNVREYKEVKSVYFDLLGGSDVMPIGGFYGPYASGGSNEGNASPDFLTEEIFQKIHDCGVNTVVYTIDRWQTNGGTYNWKVDKMLDYGEKYSIGFFIDAYAVMERIGSQTKDVDISNETWDWLEDLIEDISKNGTKKAFFGFHDQDEPFTKQLDNLNEFRKAFYALDIVKQYGIHTCTDAIGHWEGENNLWNTDESITYDTYMERYMGTEHPRFLSVTQYCYSKSQTAESVIDGLYSKLALYRKYSKQYDVPMWRMLQAGGQWNDNVDAWIDSFDPYPSEGELLKDVNTTLAYGAKGIQYFTLIQPIYYAQQTGGTYDFENRNSLIGADGNLTRWYYYAQRANNQIQAIDHVLMHADNEKILVHGATAEKALLEVAAYKDDVYKADTGYYELTKVSGDDCIIGCFNYYGKTALYVVNYSAEEKADISLTFDNDNYLFEIIQRAVSQKGIGGNINLRLDTGEGALIVLN